MPKDSTELSLLEKEIQRAAVKGDEASYRQYFSEYEKLHGGQIPLEKIKSLFFNPATGSPLVSLLSVDLVGQKNNNDNPKVRIINHMLTQFHKVYLHYWHDLMLESKGSRWPEGSLENVKPTTFTHNRSLFYWAEKNNAKILLEHPIIKRPVIVNQIGKAISQGDIQKARNLYESNRENLFVPKAQIFDNFILKIILDNPEIGLPSVIDLIAHHDISAISLAYYLRKMPPEPQVMEQIAQTRLHQLMDALVHLGEEPLELPERLAQVENSIPLYFNDISEKERSYLALSLLAYCIPFWSQRPEPPDQDTKKAYEKIVLALIKKGADFSPDVSSLSFLVKCDMVDVVKEKSVKAAFQKLSKIEQENFLQNNFYCSPEIFELLCSYMNSSKVSHNFFVQRLLSNIPEEGLEGLSTQAEIKARFDLEMKKLGILLKYDMVQGLKLVGTKRFFQDNPILAKHKGMTLEELVQEIPVLRAGWLPIVRGAELKEHYQLEKSLLEPDARSDTELTELNIPQFLHNIAQFMRRDPDVAKHILKEMGGQDVPEKKRDKTEGRLQYLALRELQKEGVKSKPETIQTAEKENKKENLEKDSKDKSPPGKPNR